MNKRIPTMGRCQGWHRGLVVLVLAGCWLIQVGWSQTDLSSEADKLFPVAILSLPAVAGEADYLAAGLSDTGIATLERADLSIVIEEGALVSGMLPNHLAGAEVLVLVELIEVDKTDYLATRIVDRHYGQILSSDLRKREGFESGWCEAVSLEVRSIQKRGDRLKTDVPKVSIQSLREEFVAGKPENELVGIALTRLVTDVLSRRSGIRLLERQDLALVQFERFLIRIDTETFEPADYVVTGSIRRMDGSSHYDLRIEPPRANMSLGYAGSIPSENLVLVAEEIAERLATHMLAGGTKQASYSRSQIGNDEADRFASEADRCLRLGLHKSAAAYAETAYLLDRTQSPTIAYILACADLLAVLPGMQGKGVVVSESMIPWTENTHQNPSDTIYEALFQERETEPHPLPTRDQWAAMILASDRISEVANRLDLQQDKRNFIGKTTPLTFALGALAGGALDNVRKRFGSTIPDFERDNLLRLSKPLVGSHRTHTKGVSLFNLVDSLFLAPSAENAVDLIRSRLYGAELEGLVEGRERDISADWSRLKQRGEPINSIEHLDAGIPFVAAISGVGITYEEAFAAAVDSAPERYRVLAEFDRLFVSFFSEKGSVSQSRACDEMRRYLMENSTPLNELGMLEYVATSLALLEQHRNVSPTYRSADFWREVHRVVYADNAWTSGDLSRCFFTLFDGSKWTDNHEEKSVSYQVFLEAIGGDVLRNKNPFAARSREMISREIATKLESMVSAVKLSELSPRTRDTMECTEEETINIESAFWSYNLDTIATCIADDGYYIFQHGKSDQDKESRLVRFEFNSQIADVAVPREIRDLVDDAIDPETLNQIFRPGALEVDSQRIALAFPGGVADYDRATEKWSVRAVPFLSGRHGMVFLGDYVASYTGYNNFSVVAPPVQGLYLTSRKTFKHTAVIDTSRRPEKTLFDKSRRLYFHFPPFPTASNQFLIGLDGFYRIDEIWSVDLLDGDPVVRRASQAGGFSTKSVASVSGNRANGSLHVVALRNPPATAPDDPFHLGAFTVNGKGEFICLLDTGTVSLNSKEKSKSRNHRLFSDDAEPQFEFPAEWRYPSGKSQAKSLVHFDGNRLLLLTNQLTADGRRLLYVWDDANRKEPRRIALRFNGFLDRDPEWRYQSNVAARERIVSIFRFQEFLCFEFHNGFFYFPVSELEARLRK